MRKEKIICWIISAAMMLSVVTTTAFAGEKGLFVVSDAEGTAGETVEINVSIENNPGIIAAAMKVYYDTDMLELISVKDRKMFPDSMFSQSYSSYPYYASWMDALATDNKEEDGVLMTLTFKILEDCESGNAEIGLEFDPADVFDWEMKEQAFRTVSGTVTIEGVEQDETTSKKPESDPEADKKDTETEDIPNDEPVEQEPVNPSDRYLCFTDLAVDGWYRSYVESMLEKGYMNGMSQSEFEPNGNVTRAQLVTILYRMEGAPSVAGLVNPFADVQMGSWYTDAVIWAAANGIVNGTGTNTFSPDANITREQLATILYRCNGGQWDPIDHLSSFADKNTISAYALDAMNWAVGAGILNGSGAELAPAASATRVQAAAMLTRYAENELIIPVPTDPTLQAG